MTDHGGPEAPTSQVLQVVCSGTCQRRISIADQLTVDPAQRGPAVGLGGRCRRELACG
ncbi:hypothetical protein D3C80_1139560 [compost metagenome]